MLSTIENEVLSLRKTGGYARLSSLSIIIVKGPDAERFLQARTSNDIQALTNNSGQLSSLLDRKAHVQAIFSIHKINADYLIIADNNQKEKIITELEAYKFNDKVEFIDSYKYQSAYVINGPTSNLILKYVAHDPTSLSTPLNIIESKIFNLPIIMVNKSITGEIGYLFFVEKTNSNKFENELKNLASQNGLTELSQETLDILRLEAGILYFGKDITSDNLLPETGLEQTYASYTKGCFLGQEVLARIKSFGAPAKAIVGLMFQDKEANAKEFLLNTKIYLDNRENEEIGLIKTNHYSPTLKKHIAFALLSKQYRVPDKEYTVSIDGNNYVIVSVELPFYKIESESKQAINYYDQGLAEFAIGDENTAIELLRKAIALNPNLHDAYEALGVILSKQDKLDEAIELMKKLEELNPNSIMAHSNLSVFYMQKGNKEAAEEEKAKAMSLRMEELAKQASKDIKEKEDKERKIKETEDRISMFKQVLAIDTEDLIANSGLGTAYVDLEQYSEAIPYLKKAISIRPNHTVAYLALGKALEKINDINEAANIYEKGISIAAQRGDMMPQKEMQMHLHNLRANIK
jgi:folate-binding protein YgfZ